MVDSNLVKTLLDIANAILQIANTPIGTFVTQTALLGGVLWGGKGLIEAMNIIPALLAKVSVSITGVGTATAAAGTASAIAAPHLFLIAGAIAAIIAVAPHVIDWFKRFTDQEYDATQKLEDYNVQLSENQTRLDELNKIPEKNRTQAIRDEIDALEDQNKTLRDNIDLQKERQTQGAFDNKINDVYDASGYNISYTSAGALPGEGFNLQVQEDGLNAFVANAEEALQKITELGYVTEEQVSNALSQYQGDAEQALNSLEFSLDKVAIKLGGTDYFSDALKNITYLTEKFETLKETGKLDGDFIDSYTTYKEALDDLVSSTEGVKEIPPEIQEIIDAYQGLTDISDEVADSYYNTEESLEQLTAGMKINAVQRKQLLKEYPQLESVLKDTGDGFEASADALKSLNEEMAETSDESQWLEQAYTNLISGMGVSEGTMNRLLQLYPELSEMIRYNSGMVYLEIDAFADSAAAGAQWANDMISNQSSVTAEVIKQTKERVKAMEAELVALSASGARVSERLSAAGRLDTLRNQLDALNSLKWSIDHWGSHKVPSGGGGGGGSSSREEDPIKKQSELFKEQIAILEDRLYIMEKSGESEEARIAQMKKIQDELHRQAEWYRSQGLSENSEYLRELGKQWWDYRNDIDKLLEEQLEAQKEANRKALEDKIKSLNSQKTAYEKAFSYVAKQAQQEIDLLEEQKKAINEKYNAQIDALNKENEALDNQIKLQEALDALARAKQSKTLVFKDGRMQYVQDIDAISEAQANLDAIRREEERKKELESIQNARDEELKAIDERIKNWEKIKKEWSSVTSAYEDEQNKLIAEQILGIDFEKKNWETRLGNLQSYVDKYREMLSEITKAQAELNANSDESTADGMSEADRLALAEIGRKWNEATTQADRDYYHAQAEAIRAKYGFSGGKDGSQYIPIKKYASGTKSATGGISLVGENGPELRVLGKQDGVLPSRITQNLWSWGMTTPSAMLSTLSGASGGSGSIGITIENFNPSLPGVQDGKGFVDYLSNNLWRQALQFVKR